MSPHINRKVYIQLPRKQWEHVKLEQLTLKSEDYCWLSFYENCDIILMNINKL